MASRSSKVLGMITVLAMTGMSLTFLAFLIDEAGRNGFEFVLAGLLGGGGFGWLLLRGPVGKAIAGMLEGGSSAEDPMLGVRLADVEDRLQEVSLETQRMMELEDRLEFAERLLAQRVQADGRER
ncbi:MAG: hypothetical protein KC544_08155 [Gemmatimonadetes bacterium]|nr:hypothetical protein [Gemmatimonadota bacterium]MCB9505547.1 hypothetical protein [Gemmatimonadales bacterium]HPF61330.1 hypothetical protein [Gemmatimonadales bacterium]HRX19505.1 hypothetical protein [Gemmatimonadales bacterium]